MFVVYPPALGDSQSVVEQHAMIWCLDEELAAKLAMFETNMTSVKHRAFLASPPDGILLFHVSRGVFVKDDVASDFAKARQRVESFFLAYGSAVA